ncbi:MAG: hypothetical protein VXW32_04710, partial [Myxococcota bacterium]|nr:hypothetical protein [Myxococcota bacterium]
MSSENDFDEVMRRLGVRRLDESGKTHSKSTPRVTAPPQNPPVPVSDKVPRTPQGAADEPTVTRSRESEELRSLKTEREQLLREIEGLRQRERALESELSELRSIDVQGLETVQGVLQDWRIRGGEDLNRWVRGLTEMGRFSEFISYLQVGHSGLLRKLVDETAVFHCGRHSCSAPSAVAILPSDLSDCEICGGLDPEPWGARLSDALLLSGKRKVVLRGHRVALLRYLAGQMDPRIQVQVVGLSVRYAVPDSSTWVALWRRSGEDTEGIEADC